MADIVTSRIFTDGEKGITAAKLNDIIASSVIQPAFYSAKPPTSTVAPTDQLLVLKTSGSYAQAPFQTVIDSVSAGLPTGDTEIWNVRMRSYNAIGNPNFEVDQVNVGTNQAPGNALSVDRWFTFYGTGNGGWTVQQLSENVMVPSTNFCISRKYFRLTTSATYSSPAATAYVYHLQAVEGSVLRELINDVHSIQLLVRSSVAGLKFGLALQSGDQSRSLTKLCTISAANTWTLITLPNIPVWPAAGNFTLSPGTTGYSLIVTLLAGTTYTASANDTWQSANVFGAVGQDNFFSKPIGSTFDMAFVQHEPSAVCSQLMDLPFDRNLDACLRYYTKSYSYAVKGGTVTDAGAISGIAMASQHPSIYTVFKKPMAKAPTVVPYSNVTGASSGVRDVLAGIDRSANSVITLGETGFGGFTVSATNASQTIYQWQYVALSGL